MTVKKLYIFTSILLLLLGCSTKKNTWVSRNYHNLTAHYNVYFNGKESYKTGVKAIQNSNQDDYTQMLTVFPDSKPEAASVASSDMDRAIEKGVKLIKKHSIRKKPKKKDNDSPKYKNFISQNEFNKWVDNAYLMIGKSHFTKHEFYLAQQSFAYMFREFRPGPEWYEAQIYMARSYIEIEDYANAKIVLDNYDLEGKAPLQLFGFFSAVYADYYMRQEDYSSAIPFMEVAARNATDKYFKTRYNFILAQLYHNQNQFAEASAAYKKVIQSNPPYELAFNAKVNRASVVFEEEGFAAVLKEVKKLLRDKRNQEYYDQIYYALGKAYLSEKQEDLATENFLLSIDLSIDNTHQKGLSYYELAKMNYVKPYYRLTYYNLDSALLNLNQNFPNRIELDDLHEDLSALVTNLDVVALEDSLQRVAKMDSISRLAFIDHLIEDEIAREEALSKEQESIANGDFFYEDMNTSQPEVGGKWYFYNQNSLSMGKMEFERRWGRRKLEDNWRRSNKEVVVEDNLADPDVDFANDLWNAEDDTTLVTSNANELDDLGGDLKSRATYLKGLPLTEEQLLASDKKIEEALMAEGLIYKDDLNNIPFAIDAFNELISRFGDHTYTEDALMNLYLCYDKENDSAGMAQTKARLMLQYPGGEFVAYLNDPDFFKKRLAQEKEIEDLYRNTYDSYLFNDFAAAPANEKKAFVIDEKSELLPKFILLSALSNAKAGALPGFERDLNRIISDYPDSEPAPMAKILLDEYAQGRVPVQGPVNSNLIDQRNSELAKERKSKLGSSDGIEVITAFNRADKVTHSLVIIINPEADINRLRFNLADYNFSKFLLNDYEMLGKTLPDGTPILEVSGFKNRLEAQDYYYSVREQGEIFEVPNLDRYNLYVITNSNLEYLISSGDQSAYNKFFEENYLSAESFKDYSKGEVIELTAPQEELIEDKSNVVKAIEDDVAGEIADNDLVQAVEDNDEQHTIKTADETQAKPEPVAKPKVVFEDTVKEEATSGDEKNVTNLVVPISTIVETEEPVVPLPEKKFIVGQGGHNAYVLFSKGRINTDRIATVFKNYTKSTFGTEYVVTSGEDAMGYFFIKVSGFENNSKAQDYISKVKVNDFLMRDIKRVEHYLLSITDINLNRMNTKESIEEYQQFYKINY